MSTQTIIRALAIVSVSAATLALPGLAHADKPQVIPPQGAFTVHVAAEDTPCGALTVHFVDRSHTTLFFDRDGNLRAIAVNGSLTAHVTSDITQRSIDLNVSGPSRFAGGDLVLTGAMVLVGPGFLDFAHGMATFPGGDLNALQFVGTKVALCPILVG